MTTLTWLPLAGEATFPATSTALAEPNGLLAAGGTLTQDWLLTAYQHGIFPWYSDGEPILWWSPTPRMVVRPGAVRINRTLRKHQKKQLISVHLNRDFSSVIDHCADESLRHDGTWITPAMKQAYRGLHQNGWAHCVEIDYDGQLAGGLYGVGIYPLFFGESMFSLAANGSKYAFVALSLLAQQQQLDCIDCQLPNDYLTSMGASMITREQFEEYLPSERVRLFTNKIPNLTKLLYSEFN